MTDTRITDFEAVAPMPIYTQADLDAAVQKEREACVQVCIGVMNQFMADGQQGEWTGAVECGYALRHRGDK